MRATGWWSQRMLIGVVAMVAWSVAGCGEPLQHGLDEREANAMVVTLETRGIEADKVRDPAGDDRWAVEVPSGQRTEAWALLEREGFPEPEKSGFDDFYPGGGLIPTAQEERVVLQYATARELQSSLLRVDDIIDVHVHLVLPEEPRVQLTDDAVSEPRASVLVQWRDRNGQPPLDQEAIRKLVSGAVEDLDEEAVHVVMTAIEDPGDELREPDFAQVGPLAVAPESRGMLRLVIGAMGAVIIALSSGLVYLVLRRRNASGGQS